MSTERAFLKFDAAALSDKGRVRENNEDNFGRFDPVSSEQESSKGWLFVVADGMGGHKAGEIASKLAVKAVGDTYHADAGENPEVSLRNAFDVANTTIMAAAGDDPTLAGMGTTCSALVVCEDLAYFAHVGDSRIYLLRNSNFSQITDDHSLVGEMVRSGMITDEEARRHPKRHVITRSLGVQPVLVTDTPSAITVAPGDLFLVCSDGLTSFVEDSEILAAIESDNLEGTAQRLVDLANDAGGRDNITVQLVRVDG